ncbi:hypothetical protein Zmor_019915 [Zophobas morio]|uniref:Uncharacterized protein n=1 Tax=Zophobas morio TaxID=2755281 RepID=A0AA38I377_9CUCU|nr:hypothetical protein Zmor_019915 [Zophobas morio]
MVKIFRLRRVGCRTKHAVGGSQRERDTQPPPQPLTSETATNKTNVHLRGCHGEEKTTKTAASAGRKRPLEMSGKKEIAGSGNYRGFCGGSVQAALF